MQTLRMDRPSSKEIGMPMTMDSLMYQPQSLALRRRPQSALNTPGTPKGMNDDAPLDACVVQARACEVAQPYKLTPAGRGVLKSRSAMACRSGLHIPSVPTGCRKIRQSVHRGLQKIRACAIANRSIGDHSIQQLTLACLIKVSRSIRIHQLGS